MSISGLLSGLSSVVKRMPGAGPVSGSAPQGAGSARTPALPAAKSESGASDLKQMTSQGTKSSLNIGEVTQRRTITEFRNFFGDVVRASEAFKGASSNLSSAAKNGNPEAFKTAFTAYRDAMSDLKGHLDRLGGQVENMKQLPRGVKDVYVEYLNEIADIARGVDHAG
jgi:hypothetical protein